MSSTARWRPGLFRERGPAGHVELLECVDESQAVALAGDADTLALFTRTDESLAFALADPGETRTMPRARLREVAMVAEGELAPDFTLESDTGEAVTLSSFRGQPVVLYFYPKDDTPGCTAQARGIRDAWGEFSDRGAVVLGVSPDTVASHRKFKEKYGLPFTLLADPEHAVAEQYGVWREKTYAGRTYMGIHRSTFVIAPDGTVEQALYGVRADGHADLVLGALTAS